MLKMSDILAQLSDFVCLLYHEARNVRHPIKAGKLDNDLKYQRLISLPKNKYAAWQEMAKVRERARKAQNTIDVANVFREEYSISLEDIFNLYKSPCWKNSAYGGNKWAPICSKIISLVEAIESGMDIRVAELLGEIRAMEHNTGRVEDKLSDLKRQK